MSFFWGTDKNEVFEGRVFFDWKKANETEAMLGVHATAPTVGLGLGRRSKP